MIALLDVNVLIALVDRTHPHHLPATAFFKTAQPAGWATCPLTENTYLCILGNPNYRNGPGSVLRARRFLAAYLAASGHHFWPDTLSLADPTLFPALPGPSALTDLYLLALAVKHRGQFATFDRRIDPALIPGGPAAYLVLPPA